MSNINELKNAVTVAQDNLYKAQVALEEANTALQKALTSSSNDFFSRWTAWTSKHNYEDIANVEAYYGPPASWRNLKKHIMKMHNYDYYTGGKWNWAEELKQYVGDNCFINAPFSDKEMQKAMEAIMKYDAINHYEERGWDM